MSSMIQSVPGVFDNDPMCGSDFQLIVRQNPECAKVAIGKEKADRKPVDPPPILQLKCTGDQSQHFLQSPYFFCSCALAAENDGGPNPAPNSIVGTLVSSLHKLKDSDNTDGGFFVFGDLSIKQEGRFRLQFDLFELRDGDCIHRTSVRSDTFTVHSPKNFPGMAESTFLTRSFSDQGVRLRLRKDSRALTSRKRTSAAAELNQMMPRKPLETVGRYYDDALEGAKRRKFSQEQGPSPHHSMGNTYGGGRGGPGGAYAVDTSVAVTQSLMNSPLSYTQPPPPLPPHQQGQQQSNILPRPNQSPVSVAYTQSPQSYGVPVQVTLAPEAPSQPYSSSTSTTSQHPHQHIHHHHSSTISMSAAEGNSHTSRGYALAPVETTPQNSYTLASIQTSDHPSAASQPSYQTIQNAAESPTPTYPSQPLSSQLPTLEYSLPTPDTPQDGTLSRSDGRIKPESMATTVSAPTSAASMSSMTSIGMIPWQQQQSQQQQQPHQSPTPSHTHNHLGNSNTPSYNPTSHPGTSAMYTPPYARHQAQA